MQALLLDDLLVLLQRQEERLVLRCQSRPVSALDTAKLSLSPIVRLSSAITRQVATGRCGLHPPSMHWGQAPGALWEGDFGHVPGPGALWEGEMCPALGHCGKVCVYVGGLP